MELNYEQSYFDKGFLAVAGVDEVGRGTLAGPVTAACAIITPDFKISPALEAVNDSKKLSPKKREQLFDILCQELPAFGLGWISPERIDEINILNAALEAMAAALSEAKLQPDIVLIDGNTMIPGIAHKQKTIINGDQLAFSIAAASIIAKVSRDRLMNELDKQYPDYGLAVHKGYGTPKHLEALWSIGPSPIHRFSFAPLKGKFNPKAYRQ